MYRRWTEKEDARLQFDWGVFTVATLAKRLDRTPSAVVQRAHHLGLGPPSRNTVTVVTLARTTGYDKSQIRSAAKALGIHIGRVPSTAISTKTTVRWSAISEEDQESILEFLGGRPDGTRIRAETKGAWGGPARGGGLKPTHCVVCQKNDRPHYAKGACVRCYDQQRKQPPPQPQTGISPCPPVSSSETSPTTPPRLSFAQHSQTEATCPGP